MRQTPATYSGASTGVHRLSTDDLTNLVVEAPDTPMHIGVVAILDGPNRYGDPPDLDRLRSAIGARLDRVPRLRQMVHTPGLLAGRPLWTDDPTFVISRHVNRAQVPAPGGEAQLLRLVEELMAPPLDRAHPLWQVWYLTGLPAGRTAVLVKLHHAVADGLAALYLISELLVKPYADPDLPVPWSPQPPPRWRYLVRERLATWTPPRVAHRWPAVRAAARALARAANAPRTSLNAPVGPRRRLAVVRLDVATAKAVGHRYGVTVNDLILDLVAGGLRALLQSRGEPVAGLAPRAAVAVSLRTPAEADQPGNRSGVMVVPLPLGEPDPTVRLAVIHHETVTVKRDRYAGGSSRLLVWLARSGLMRWYIRRQHLTNLVESNVTGPTEPVRMLGAPVLELIPIGVLAGNLAVAFLALSYAGQLVVSVVADADRYPDLPVLVDAMRQDWASLAAGPHARPEQPGRS